jgi:D-serine deaminase-like pyridoxal phosphate-dependent protein
MRMAGLTGYARRAVEAATEQAPSRASTADRGALLARYEAAFEGVQAPFAFVDLDAMEENGRRMLAQAGGLPIRVASKSIRCLALLRRALGLDAGFRGILAFTLPEALWLADQGFEDIVVAYPTADRDAIAELTARAAEDPARVPVLMVDDTPHLDMIEGTIGGGRAEVPVCLDIDVSWWPLRGRLTRIGPKRSPVHHPWKARKVALEICERPGTRLSGLMAYEGHIAGVGDRIPGRPLRSLAIRAMQSASERDIRRRMPAIVAEVREVMRERGAGELEFVNAGGTGSLARTAAGGFATELSAGSGFYAPALFDNYRSLDLLPAAFFTVPVVRRPAPGVATALGGGYLASGPATRDRLPVPWLPDGLDLDPQEGAGEVQTPLTGIAAKRVRIGDRIYMRHAKAGELCERFDSLYLVQGDRVVDRVPTYRGEGKAFL